MVTVTHGRELTNARMRRLLLALEAVIGRAGLMTILRQARLHRFTGDLPQYNRELRLHAAEYSGVIQAVESYFGRGARGTLIRVGRGVFDQLLVHQRWQALQYRVAFLTQPPAARMQRALAWLADELAQPNGHVEVLNALHGLILVDHESDGVFGRRREAPGCWLTVGKIQAAIFWATGQEHDVVETECKGAGAAACRFEVRELRP
ncbi:MAG: 4-vinyl reductase [Anaerolineales bacterium]|nr:4-vinyl reductase [Anaerolineales bacterium]